MNYQLQNRYQDSGWETLEHEKFEYLTDANGRAKELSKNAVAYGMVRVVNRSTGNVEVEYPAGGDWKEDLPKPPEQKPDELWHEYVVMMDGLTGKATIPMCGLCGNTGFISTLDDIIRTPNGDCVPSIYLPCICPNGRSMKEQGRER